MSRRDTEYKPRSLTQHFEPPEGYVGRFGWICGYSADSGFLNDAIERFTGKTLAQRAYEGNTSIALMLDDGNEQITPVEVPGLLHLPIKSSSKQPFKLLHAKIAILGFRHDSQPKQWRLKLIVSTGNWTRSTLEESLDLVWCAEIGSEDLKEPDEATKQAAADITGARDLIQWLIPIFDIRVLNPSPPNGLDLVSKKSAETFRRWTKQTQKIARQVTPQFLDNRNLALLDQLPDKIGNCSTLTARNYLALGSGFYELSKQQDRVPTVLKQIVDRLHKNKLLTTSADVEIYVNPLGCQAVATSIGAIRDSGWLVFNAAQPSYFQAEVRSLHAKFIFGCSYRGNSNNCNSAWLYLGSGNLTQPGFTNSIHADYGNLEAGVVFSPQGLQWIPLKGVLSKSLLSNRLPVGSESEYDDDSDPLSSGSDMPEREPEFSAAPIAYCYWNADEQDGWLVTDCDQEIEFQLLDSSGEPCSFEADSGFRWQGVRPRQVQVSWEHDGRTEIAWVPVIDEYGRIAATVLPRIEIDQAWAQLENFPMPPDDEDLAGEGREDDGGNLDGQSPMSSSDVKYPIRQMMQLVENVAAKQVSVHRMDWSLWCSRFEQCLTQASDSNVVSEFAKLGLNPLSPLMHRPFRPKFAEDETTAEGKLFEVVLHRVQSAWKVSNLAEIGCEE